MGSILSYQEDRDTIITVRNALRTQVNNESLTYATIAKESGISSTALSQFMNDGYRGDNARIAGQLAIWLENRKQRVEKMPHAPDFVQTKTAKQIHSALQYAQLAQCITVIYGSPGVGKSKALEQFTHERPNVWLITASPSRATLSECLYELALALGLSDLPRRAGQLGRAVRRKLSGTAGLLIIDEADHLDYAVLEELRILQEETHIGLALVGNHHVYAKLTGGASRSVDFARLFSRIAKKVAILKTKKEDITAIAEAWGLTGHAEFRLIQNLAERPGALRTLSHTLRLAAMFASGANESLTETHIRAAVKDLEGASV